MAKVTAAKAERIRELLIAGATELEICRIVSVSTATVRAFKAHDTTRRKAKRPWASTAQLAAPGRAIRTAIWARIMAKWAIKRAQSKRQWEVVNFTGKARRESAGIVDLLFIRKDHSAIDSEYRRGDLFEMVLVQVKGGGAKRPTELDVGRLRAVEQFYKAKAVLLAEWSKGEAVSFSKLADGTDPWVKLNDNALRREFA